MDWTALGLSRNPFQRCPELDDACLPNAMAAQLSELLSGLRSPQGVSVLVGESGSGKSMAAEAFARRLQGVAHVALVDRPTSSAMAIARDALVQLDPDEFDAGGEEDWMSALRERTERGAEAGRATVVLLDNAHRLSPQALEGLAELFGEDDALRLHVVLFGRPSLIDKMDAAAERALDAHLLQICQLDPLGVRDSVRYLERRLAICGGDLGQLFTDEAIDEIVQTAGGRLLHLEEVSCEALRRATGRGGRRASVEDVVARARHDEDGAGRVAAGDQQPLEFEIDDEDESEAWNLADGPVVAGGRCASSSRRGRDQEGADVEWGDDEGREEKEWLTDDAEDLDWGSTTYLLQEDDSDHAGNQGEADHYDLAGLEEQADELEEPADAEDAGAGARISSSPVARRLVGPGVISAAACLALMWAANNVPGPGAGASHGRDAKLFAEKLSSEPSEIMRLAKTVEAADADAHVVAWKAVPPREVARRSRAVLARSSAAAGRGGADASSAGRDPVASAARRADDDQLGGRRSLPTASNPAPPAPPAPRAVSAAATGALEAPAAPTAQPSVEAKAVRPSPSVESPVVAAAKPAARRAPTQAGRGRESQPIQQRTARGLATTGPVFTVQLGAFKTRKNAEVLARKLQGKAPKIMENNGLYRVVSGSFSSKSDAAAHEAALKRDGYSTFLRTASF